VLVQKVAKQNALALTKYASHLHKYSTRLSTKHNNNYKLETRSNAREELRVIIPPCRDDKNQSINHTREILRKRMTQEFIPRFTYFPASYSPLWRYTHLLIHELIDYQESSPRRTPHNHTQDGDPLSHELH
jgi:hypothetical protein